MNVVVNSRDFAPHAQIGPGFHARRPTGVVFGQVTGGSNFPILQHACLGARDRKADRTDHANYLRIGDNVEVGPSSAVLGPIHIGDGAVVGANAVVLVDVPAGCVAVGNPPRVIHRNRPEPFPEKIALAVDVLRRSGDIG